jgi:hypothetical protein
VFKICAARAVCCCCCCCYHQLPNYHICVPELLLLQLQKRLHRVRTCVPKLRCQNWQSAAPPAMVPSRYLLISITFFTV